MSRYLITGGEGLVGRALVQKLKAEKKEVYFSKRSEIDLTDSDETLNYFKQLQPTHVINAAAKVGGIRANNLFPADFIYQNVVIQTNIINAAAMLKIPNLVFLGSSCIYPKNSNQPILESELLNGPLESTNEWYAIAKISGLKMVQAFRKQYGFKWISVMPNNVYGPYDNFNIESGHVIGALINKFVSAKKVNENQVEVWGTGKARREFIYVDDLADAILFCSENYDSIEPINIGTGSDVTIKELAYLIKDLTNFGGKIVFNTNFPDGTPRKLVNIQKISNLGWQSSISLHEGLSKTIEWYLANLDTAKR